jgi:hypothetical protein
MDLLRHHLGPWFLGLFLMAQIAGVVPLMLDHAVHAFEDQPAVASTHDHGALGRHGDHRHGLADIQDECCTLHHLAGIAAPALSTTVIGIVTAPIEVAPQTALATADPMRLERPPKSLSLI